MSADENDRDSPEPADFLQDVLPESICERIQGYVAEVLEDKPKLASSIASQSTYPFSQHEKDLERHFNETLKTGEFATHLNYNPGNTPVVGDINCELASRTAAIILTKNSSFEDLKLSNRRLSTYLSSCPRQIISQHRVIP